jgi:predicted O-methyltransferase YrrM
MRVMSHFVLWCLGLAQPETQTTSDERNCLARYAFRKKLLAEIGVWHAVTTCRLRASMAPNGILVAVDPFPAGRLGFSAQRLIARTELKKIPNGAVKWIRCPGDEAAQRIATTFEKFFDFVFIDGDHSYRGLQKDWEAWSQVVAPGGILAIHDSCSSASRQIDDAGSVVFTREVILQDSRVKLVEIVDTLSVLEKEKSD